MTVYCLAGSLPVVFFGQCGRTVPRVLLLLLLWMSWMGIQCACHLCEWKCAYKFSWTDNDAVLHSSVEVVSILNPGVKTYIVASVQKTFSAFDGIIILKACSEEFCVCCLWNKSVNFNWMEWAVIIIIIKGGLPCTQNWFTTPESERHDAALTKWHTGGAAVQLNRKAKCYTH